MPERGGLSKLVVTVVVSAMAAGCSLVGGDREQDTEPSSAWDPAVSLTAHGQGLAEHARLVSGAPRYVVRARLRPASGVVAGTVRADLPVGDATVAQLRYFPALPDLDASALVGSVRVDDEPVRVTQTAAIVRVPLGDDHGTKVRLDLSFRYRVPAGETGGLLDALGGLGSASDVGLLTRRDDALMLGHWFPIWLPPGASAAPEPDGPGDIGSTPAALIRADVTVPLGWEVVSGGVDTSSSAARDGRRRFASEGFGMNDLALAVVRGFDRRTRELAAPLQGVRVTVHGPADDPAALDDVLAETVSALEVLSGRLTAYPWRELDVVSAPLGGGAGGMEWPGATWIESSLFAGGVPGLGALGELGGLTGPGSPIGGDTGRMLATLREWTVAHEVGHEWWHVLVGNDSVRAPAVDEPLAQYSACLVLRARHEDGDELCHLNIDPGYEQMRLLGGADGRVLRATTGFDSASQYAGLVYGKAAAFYLALDEQYGEDAVVAALAGIADDHAFTMIDHQDLRRELGERLPAKGTFEGLWQRWMVERHGDADLGVSERGGRGSGDLGALLESLLGN